MSTLSPNSSIKNKRKKITLRTFQAKKQRGEPITMLTAYDYPTAFLLDEAGVDSILVGDSLGMVVLGYENTLPVTMEDMLHHCRAVARGAKNPLLIGDMPFMSYQASVKDAVCNAGRFLQEAGMDAIKLEGGRQRCKAIHTIVAAGIPVMGHLGLTPQSVNLFGGFRSQVKTADAGQRLLDDALYLQEAGCFSIVLESVPARLAAYISQQLEIPTIGIGAGAGCDGQVLVLHDLLGFFERAPKFAKRYTDLRTALLDVFAAYIIDVQACSFPAAEHTIEMVEEEWDLLMQRVNELPVSSSAESVLP